MISPELPEQWALGVGSAAIHTPQRIHLLSGGHFPRVRGAWRVVYHGPKRPCWRQEAQGHYRVNLQLELQPRAFGAYFKPSEDSKSEKAQKCRLPPPPPTLPSKMLSGPNAQAPTARLSRAPAPLFPLVGPQRQSPSFGIPGVPTTAPGGGRHWRGSQGCLIPPLLSRFGASTRGLKSPALFIHRPGAHVPGLFHTGL